MSDTPRTDEAEFHPVADEYAYVTDADFARRLESELKIATDALESIGEYRGEGGPGKPWQTIVRDMGQEARNALQAIQKPTNEPTQP